MSGLAAADPARAAAFVALVNARPMPDLIAGLTTRMSLFEIGDAAFPLTVNDRDEAGNCYICRPSAAYIDYALEEIRHFARQPLLHRSMAGLIRACRPLMRASGLDHQVQINNWLFSTNPVPALGAAEAALLRDRLCADHPGRALVIRSLNDVADGESMAALRGAGFQLLPARRIWLYDGRCPQRSRDIKRDEALLRDGLFQTVTEFSPQDYHAAAELYGQLYLQKYTPLNPQYQGLFLSEMHRAGLLDLIALRSPKGALVAVTGLFESGQTLTQPVVGYDTSRPEAEGLYRRMMALSRQRAERAARFFNMSAGAAGFKKNRRAQPVIEYTAVFTGHLPARQRQATALIAGVLTRLGIPLLQRFDL